MPTVANNFHAADTVQYDGWDHRIIGDTLFSGSSLYNCQSCVPFKCICLLGCNRVSFDNIWFIIKFIYFTIYEIETIEILYVITNLH